jgi:hypothetical protein
MESSCGVRRLWDIVASPCHQLARQRPSATALLFIHYYVGMDGRLQQTPLSHLSAFRVEADTVQLNWTDEGFLVIIKEPWEIFFKWVVQLSNDFLGSARDRSWNHGIDLKPFEVFDCNGATYPAFCGPIRHELEQAGQAIGATDLLLAARALALVATLMTKKPCAL